MGNLSVVEIGDHEEALAETYGIRQRPGWAGAYTTRRAVGALPCGERVLKANSEPGDGTPDGQAGTVLGSVGGDALGGAVLYFVEWDGRPRVAVGVAGQKLAPAPRGDE
jgi:hypothetical protein